MKAVFRASFGAVLCGLLLFVSYTVPSGLPVAILALFLFGLIVVKTPDFRVRFFSETVFLLVYIVLQYHFLVRLSQNGDIGPILVLLILTIVYIAPFILIRLLAPRGSYEVTFFALWIADVVFAHLPIGNPLCRYALLLGDYPVLAQWLHWGGMDGGSLWVLALGALFICLTTGAGSWKLLTAGLLLPIILSVLIWFQPTSKERLIRVAVHPFDESPEMRDIYESILEISSDDVDLAVYPEGQIRVSSAEVAVHPLVTEIIRRRRSEKIPDIVIGLLSYDQGIYDNIVCVMTGKGSYFRRKQKLVPFSEYLPLEKILEKIEPARSHMAYPQKTGINESETCNAAGIRICPLICYEALFPEYLQKCKNEELDLFIVSSSNSMVNCRHIERLITKALRINAIWAGNSFVRCTEHGISSVIDYRGEILWMSTCQTNWFIIEVPIMS